MWEHLFKIAFVSVYVGILLTVAFYGFHRYILVYLYIKHRHNTYHPKAKWTELPRVTVQLPMYNEDLCAERIIKATCQIDYPLDKLDIQVLDDSTDHSADIARAAVDEMAAQGFPVTYIHRDNRVGYKAGALEAGLKVATGDYIAIFDADFVPPKDILHNIVDFFTDEKIGCVQVRWDHLNRDASLLTKSQAIFLDGHFVIEHTARNRSGRFMHFNGTAGVWRRSTIGDAGGWQHDTVTEDLDLSYRAQVKGWQFIYLPQFCAPAELPPEMIGFKQQAHRWTKGSMQTAIKLLPGILKSKHLSRRVKSEAFFHLTNTVVYPMMVLLTIMMYPAFIYADGPIKHYTWSNSLFTASLFVLATCSASTFFVFAQRELFGKVAGWKSFIYQPFLMALGIGVSINNAKAVVDAIWTAIKRKPSEFVRTPKYGVRGKVKNDWKHREDPLIAKAYAGKSADLSVSKPNFLTLKRLALPIIEITFGCYMSSFIFISLWYSYARGSVPFLMMFAGGYFYVGFTSLYVLYKMQQEAEAAIEAPEAPDVDVEAEVPFA
jgi:cellulose synthase/poly-beta-1,6-N-acetylglucosamine synthase-like glycosyltransferase